MNTTKLQKNGTPLLFLVLLLAVLIISFFPVKAIEATPFSPVLMVTDISGHVSRAKPRVNSSVVSLLDQLEEGDVLKFSTHSYAVLVYLKSGLEIRVDGPGFAQVGAKDMTVSQGAHQHSKQIHYKGIAGEEIRINPIQTRIAGIVMRDVTRPEVKLDNLQDTSILVPHPVFRWHTTASATAFYFKLTNQDKTIYERRTRALSLKLPDSIKIESNQPYTWLVQAKFSARIHHSDWGSFTLLPTTMREQVAQRKPLEDASFSDQVLYAIWLEQNNLFDAAVQQWRFLAHRRPKEQVLQKLKMR